jgi:hypothetical protein
MFKIIRKEKGQLEIALTGHVTSEEFEGILTELQNMSKEYGTISVLLDFRTLDGYDKIFIDKPRFFDSVKDKVGRTAVVTGGVSSPVFFEYMRTVSKEYQRFDASGLDEARNWVFGESP